jgi:hypothetical protein
LRKSAIAIVMLALIGALASSPMASAKHVVHLDVTVEPGTTYHDSYKLAKGEVLSNAWTSDLTLRFYVTDPSGAVIRHSNGTGGQELIEAVSAGNYTLNWQNTGTGPTNLVSDSTTLPEEHESITWLAVLAVVIALIALIVAVIAVVVQREKKG